MKYQRVLLRVLLYVSVFILFAAAPSLGIVSAQDEVTQLLNRINELRASRGLHNYTLNGALSAAARQQAQWMAETGAISHVQTDGSTPRTRALANGYASTDVSENIYMGTNATVGAAWNFWVNSPIHFRGLTNGRYREVGIGVARGAAGRAYVLVFGNPGGLPPPPSVTNNTGDAAASGPPPYVLGVDENGYILHEIQPGDTLGDIALIYGYTWEDIPYMMELNLIEDNRTLEIGSVFLVPPHDGTFTPTPAESNTDAVDDDEDDAFALVTNTPRAEQADDVDEKATPALSDTPRPTNTPKATATATPTVTPSPTLPPVATANTFPEEIFFSTAIVVPTSTPSPTLSASETPEGIDALDLAFAATEVAVVDTASPPSSTTAITRSDNGRTRWIIAAIAVQGVVLLGAGFEFLRRLRHRS